MIQLIMDTGMRLGETLSLVIDAIDLDRRVILIPADTTKVKKKKDMYFLAIQRLEY